MGDVYNLLAALKKAESQRAEHPGIQYGIREVSRLVMMGANSQELIVVASSPWVNAENERIKALESKVKAAEAEYKQAEKGRVTNGNDGYTSLLANLSKFVFDPFGFGQLKYLAAERKLKAAFESYHTALEESHLEEFVRTNLGYLRLTDKGRQRVEGFARLKEKYSGAANRQIGAQSDAHRNL